MSDESAIAPQADAAPETAPATETPAVDPIAAAQAEAAELKDRLLRTLAEMENLRRRTEKEVREARDYAVSGFARDLLAVADNFDRALSHVPAELRESTVSGAAALIEGVELTGRELLKVMEKHGVRKLSPQGERFDPNLHQAMFEIANPDVPAGTVLQVLQDGFAIAGRVLRPALVGVAKGGPRIAAVDASAPAPGTFEGIDRTV
ncbi:nucleotide exchange factor GrpE [Siculibacillus lacustris]|uniref:Protein GrpE n=1 Tax=Siculibacillus lacustris TaxID=1549641 RepID=A0A4Q9VT23_9HYPH|nr:nucleotide exchange factor GrpE [Siculibacillus lacustris]TBW39216.1 nucleotide exchange factor GrpE [Siculibacillus lacustris]